MEINLSAYEAGHDMKFGFDTDTHFIALTGKTTSGNLPGVSITPGEVQKTASLWVDGTKVEDWGRSLTVQTIDQGTKVINRGGWRKPSPIFFKDHG